MRKDESQSKLTPKELEFARCIASGMTQSDAYREAYDVGPTTKPETIHVKASQIAKREKVRTRIDALLLAKERGITASSLSDREYVLRKLRELSESASSADSAKIRALELLGKASGLFREQAEDTRKASSDALADEIKAKLAAIQAQISPDQPSSH